MQDSATTPQWEEENSQDFIDYGKYFVPDREVQINCICEVIPPPSKSAHILDLCCGEGLLTHNPNPIQIRLTNRRPYLINSNGLSRLDSPMLTYSG